MRKAQLHDTHRDRRRTAMDRGGCDHCGTRAQRCGSQHVPLQHRCVRCGHCGVLIMGLSCAQLAAGCGQRCGINHRASRVIQRNWLTRNCLCAIISTWTVRKELEVTYTVRRPGRGQYRRIRLNWGMKQAPKTCWRSGGASRQ